MRYLFTLIFYLFLSIAGNAFVPPGTVQRLSEEDGLSSNHVWCCMQDSRGFLWIGTDTGLDRYDGVQIKSLEQPTRCLAESDGVIWAGTEEGLWTYNHADGCFSPFKAVTNYGVNIISRVNAITVTEGPHLWIGTEGQGLFLYNPKTGDLAQHSVQTPFVERVIPEPSGRIIVSDRDGNAHLYSAKGEYLHSTEESLPPQDNSIVDREGTRWSPTDGDGLLKQVKENTGLTVCTLPVPADPSVPVSLTEDGGGNIIAGIKDKLYLLAPGENQFRLLGAISPHGHITQLLNAPEGIWIGTDSDCICRYVPASRHTYHYHTGGRTHVLYRTKQGTLLAGTSLGVFSWDPEQDRLSRDLNSKDIQILIDGKKSEKTLPKEFEVVSQSSVVAMCEDASGHYLYLATSNRGIFRKDLVTKGWEHLLTAGSNSPVLPWNKITAMLLCADGTIWAGTDGEGLWTLNPNALSFSQASPPDSRIRKSKVYSFTEDASNNLWVCTSSGLIILNPQSMNVGRLPIKAESILYATDGKLYLGGKDGIASLQPQSQIPSYQWPSTIISEVSVGDSIYHIPPGGRNITLTYPQNSFTITMAALSYADPGQNLYSWQLTGIDSDWTVPARISTATYKKVRPGEYVFRVKGSDDTLHITVRPPWWRTAGAILLYFILGAAGIIYLMVNWQRRIKHRYDEMMRKQDEERERVLYKQRIRFFIGLIHEIRTPLTLIRLQHEKDAPGKTDTITRNLDYMQETIDRILTYDKNTSGNIQMLKVRLNLQDVVTAVTDTFREGAAAEHIDLETTLDNQPIFINADEDMLTKILTNLLSNAIKYTKNRINVTVTTEGDNALVIVSDNGPGVKKEYREKIFGMFYTAPDDNIAEASGIGVGLAYARQLATAHEGTINVEDNVGGGASFVLRIPALKEELPREVLQPVYDATSEEKLTILVAEDNRELRETLQKDLSAFYDVITAPDGRAALSLVEKKAVDVVVSDVMMPVMDGFTLCRTLKGQLAYSHIPVILLTAKVTLDAKSEGMESGADAYIEKPFTIRQLKGQIDNLIRLREAFRESVSAHEAPDFPIPSGPEADFIHSINDSIEKQLNEENFSIEGLAYDMAMSRTNFFRKFRALTGVTPNEYLKNYRLDRAAKLIREGARINEAAESVGFTSSSYFAKCFKARFGVRPKDYAPQS